MRIRSWAAADFRLVSSCRRCCLSLRFARISVLQNEKQLIIWISYYILLIALQYLCFLIPSSHSWNSAVSVGFLGSPSFHVNKERKELVHQSIYTNLKKTNTSFGVPAASELIFCFVLVMRSWRVCISCSRWCSSVISACRSSLTARASSTSANWCWMIWRVSSHSSSDAN